MTLIPPSGRIWGELSLAFRIRFINGSSFGWAQLAAATLPPLSYPRPPRWTPLCSMGNPTGPGLKTSSPYSAWSRPYSLPPMPVTQSRPGARQSAGSEGSSVIGTQTMSQSYVISVPVCWSSLTWNPSAVYWPSRLMFAVCAPSLTVSVPPVPSAFAK